MTRQEKRNRIDTLKRLLEETEGITADEDTENSMATPREDAENYIRAVDADRIIKYYFKILQEEKK